MSSPVVRRYTQQIDAAPDRVFPLLCPVREAEWLHGWGDLCRIVHSASGVAEEGCVFVTHPPGGPETVWAITGHDPGARVVEFWRVTTGLAATRLTIAVSPAGTDRSAVAVTYTHTPLGEDGRVYLAEHHSEDAFRASMAWWEQSMNHWLRTGQCLRPEP
jgi:hypothetical protein